MYEEHESTVNLICETLKGLGHKMNIFSKEIENVLYVNASLDFKFFWLPGQRQKFILV